jgi:hypothetical protein
VFHSSEHELDVIGELGSPEQFQFGTLDFRFGQFAELTMLFTFSGVIDESLDISTTPSKTGSGKFS